jgi:GH25 family lysozyme M1 (1,4-beta-N-acetylmuramidase)
MDMEKVCKRAAILFCMLGVIFLCLPPSSVWAASKLKGFDVSSKNGEIDWEAVAESGMDFVMIRTGEGQAPDMDAQFERNYEGAVAAGLKVGVYHVCCVRTAEAAKKEAEYHGNSQSVLRGDFGCRIHTNDLFEHILSERLF